MLHIRQEGRLADRLNMDLGALYRLAESANDYCEELLLHDPAKPQKQRLVLDVRGDLRRAQCLLHKRIFLTRFQPSRHSFGGVRGRHIKSNVEEHRRSGFVFSCDISDFYPNINCYRVYDFFLHEQACSPAVSRLLASLCTCNNQLALGLITSPILADQILLPTDKRIGAMANQNGLVYTRYVDDITLSAPFDLRGSGFPQTIKRILEDGGFRTNAKDQFGRIGDPDVLVTKLRINRGRIDVSHRYFDELCRIMRDLRGLGGGGELAGPYYTRGQVWGKCQFAIWVNPGRRRMIRNLFRSVNWARVRAEATRKALIICKKTLTRTVAQNPPMVEPYRDEDYEMATPC